MCIGGGAGSGFVSRDVLRAHLAPWGDVSFLCFEIVQSVCVRGATPAVRVVTPEFSVQRFIREPKKQSLVERRQG